MRILGIDPGLRNTGFGVIEILGKSSTYITSGTIATNSQDPLAKRLQAILKGLDSIIQDYEVSITSIEKVFVNKNPQATLLLGQARGTAISACVLHDLAVYEYTALQIKQSIAGHGHASKEQVAKMVQHYLQLNKTPQGDSADALAIALTHFYSKPININTPIKSIRHGRLII